MLAVLLGHWWIATRSGLQFPDGDNARRREFGRITSAQPIAFLVSLAFIYVSPSNALGAFAITLFLLIVASSAWKRPGPPARSVARSF